MDRRGLLAAAAGGALAWGIPGARGAQMKRLAAFVDRPQLDDREGYAKSFASHGFRVGENLDIRWFEFSMRGNRDETVPPVTARLIEWNPDCISTGGEVGVMYLRKATTTIPIVANLWFGDPVDLGFAKSLGRPGGNVTGVHSGAAEVNIKRMQLLKSLVPGLSGVAWIAFPTNLVWFPTFEKAAQAAGLRVRKVLLRETEGTFEATRREIGQLAREGFPAAHFHSGVPQVVDAVTAAARESRLVVSYSGERSLASREGIFFMYEGRFQVPGYSNTERMAALIARILRGESPAEIAFEGPAGYHLRLNRKTAARIGVKVPLEVSMLANEVL